MKKLTTDPDKTLDYVSYMHYLDECHKHIEQLTIEIDFAYQCFMLINDFNIPIADEEKENFMGKCHKNEFDLFFTIYATMCKRNKPHYF